MLLSKIHRKTNRIACLRKPENNIKQRGQNTLAGGDISFVKTYNYVYSSESFN